MAFKLLLSLTMRRPPRQYLGRICKTYERFIFHPTMMLLMGIWMSLTKNPMNPMMANPMAVAIAIFWNSFFVGFGTPFDKANGILSELPHGLNGLDNLIH